VTKITCGGEITSGGNVNVDFSSALLYRKEFQYVGLGLCQLEGGFVVVLPSFISMEEISFSFCWLCASAFERLSY